MSAAKPIYVPKIEVIDPLSMGRGRRGHNLSARRMTFHKPGGSTPPPVPQPSDKAGMIWGIDPRSGVSFSSGINVSQVLDASGGTRHTTFAAGKEAQYQASYSTTGKPALKLLSTTLGIFSTDVLIAAGADHGIFMLLHNVAEADPYYHTFICFRTAVAASNQNIVVTSDPNYGTFGGILPFPGVGAVGNVGATATITANPSALIWNYTGASIASSTSYNARLNNSSLSLATLAGGASNSSNGNYINSYGNGSPPQFPATNSFLIGAWIYDSPISNAEADDIFKPFAESYNMVQA